MSKTLIALTLVGALALVGACDSADPGTGDDDPIDTPMRSVVYEVFGTYRTCDIPYNALDGTEAELIDEPLDWIDSVKVEASQSFLARVAATCADIEHDGKATIRLIVDGLVVGTDDVQGFGDSGAVQRLLQPRG